MSSVILTGDTSGTLTVSAPLVAGSNTLTLAAATGTLSPLVSATAVDSTSGTSIDFTGIPSWAKRITVMLSGVSTSGTSNLLMQLGAGSVTTSGYVGGYFTTGDTGETFSSGFIIRSAVLAANLHYGSSVVSNVTSNTWSESGVVANGSASNIITVSGGSIALGGTLDRVRITTVNGTDTFDAGSINIMYEG
jgi:hypothetical protein